MSKRFETHFVSWRDAKNAPLGFFVNEHSYAQAAASALEAKLVALAEDGWIVDRIIPATGMTPKQCAGFTIVAFK
ncbi:MAG: hypothetical protein AAGH38_12210 [Pseudomonadota bacterium]